MSAASRLSHAAITMRRMALPLFLLLVTSFSSAGLILLWAATSRVHWFARAAVLLTIVILLAQLSSAGPLALFGLQGVVVLTAIGAWRFWNYRKADREAGAAAIGWRFSLSDSLLATVVVAIMAAVLAVVVRTASSSVEEYDVIEWPVVAVGGVGFGFVTLVAARCVAHRQRFVRSLAAIAVAAGVLGVALQWLEPAFMGNLQSEFDRDSFSTDGTIQWYAWGTLILAMWFAMTVTCALHVRRGGLQEPGFLRWSSAMLALLIAALPLFVFIRLMQPPPIPRGEAPNPNGFSEIAAAGQNLDVRLINLAYESPQDQVAVEVTRLKAHFDVGERGVRTPCVVPLTYTMDDIDTDYFSSCRTLARAFSARAGVALSEGRIDDAIRDFDNNLKLANACHTGGIAIHYLVALAIDGYAHGDVWNARETFDQGQCKELIASLQHALDSADSTERMLQRERAWTANATGFYSQLSLILADLQGGPYIDRLVVKRFEPRRRAALELLKLELAIREFVVEHDRLPAALEDLVPKWIDKIPVDPFDPTGGALRYHVRDDGYMLYSVGENNVDDGGVVMEDDESWNAVDEGDYRLDAAFDD